MTNTKTACTTDLANAANHPALAVELCGVRLKNPVLAASGTFGFGREYYAFYDLSQLGGICTKGLSLLPREGNDPPRIAEARSGVLNSVGLQNPGLEAFLAAELPYMRTLGTAIIANITGNTAEEYCQMAAALSNAVGVDILELNISCPNVKKGGMTFGVKPESVLEITRAVRAHAKRPLMVKLTPNVASIAENALAAQEGGADALSLINTLGGMAVDVKTRRPVLANVVGGLSGACVKPVALKMVFEACRAVKIPVVGIGGITTAEDALEFMLCGATAVQVGTANLSDPLACPKIIAGLAAYADREKLRSISEIRGALRT